MTGEDREVRARLEKRLTNYDQAMKVGAIYPNADLNEQFANDIRSLLALIEPVMEENEQLRGTLEKIVDHESNVSDDHTECENCRDAFFDDYFEVRALARAALSPSEKQDG
jgi:hypothetical protein